VKSHAKAATAGSTMRRASGLGRIFRGAGARRGGFSNGNGSGAPSRRHSPLVLLTALALTALAALVPGTAAAATADDPFPLERVFDFGPEGAVETEFEWVDSIALDQQDEHVYVLEREDGGTRPEQEGGTLLKFGPDGEPVDFAGTSPYIDGNRITGLEPFPAVDPNDPDFHQSSTQLAVDSTSGVIYVTEGDAIRAFEADGEPAEFTAGLGAGTSEIPGFTELVGVAVDANGSIYASDHSGTVSVLSSTGAPLTSFAVSGPRSVGVDSNEVVYVQAGNTITRFTPSSFPVTAGTTYTESLFVEPVIVFRFLRGFAVDSSSDDVYVLESDNGETSIRRYDGTGLLVESFGAPGSPSEDEALDGASEAVAAWGQAKEISEGEAVKLYVDERDTARVVAMGRDIVVDQPDIANTSVLDVTADSAKLRAWVDPNTKETTYHFEYGLEDCAVSACTVVPPGGATVGDGEEPVEVSEPIFGLQPDTTYHYRVVAENELGSVAGPGRTFKTQPLGTGFELADLRVWEMVSPPDKRGAILKGTRGGMIQAASDGEGLAYFSAGSIESDPQGNRSPEYSSILAQRGPGGWHSQDITSANQEVVHQGVGEEGEFKLFSSDLSQGLLAPRSSTPLSPQATERTPYLRLHGEPPVYTPLLTSANVPPGTKFGGRTDIPVGPVKLAGATPTLSHVVLESGLDVPLVPGLPTPTPGALYLWTAGQLEPISLLPAGEGGSLASGPAFGSEAITVQNAISVDGSRVFWGMLANLDGGTLYVRDTVAEQTVRLDVPQGGSSGGGATPVFQGASADGTVVFFTDTRDLTVDASPSGRDLYRCEIPAGGPAAGCASLSNLSVPLGPGESGAVLDLVAGLSEDGATVYFTAKGVLDEAPNQYGDVAAAGEPNLYSWEEGMGVRFIAGLDEEDRRAWGISGGSAASGARSATVSPSGRHLVFMSQRSLTGRDNLEATSGEPVQQVFRYDAVTEALDCLSCDPFGAAPEGDEPVEVSRPLISPGGLYSGLQIAAALPAASEIISGKSNSLYHARTALDNGRVFFNAFDSLVPADSNGEWDVYQWEPTGVGGCSASSGDAATARSAGGCVSLLSSGTAEAEAGFFDASASGDDVFFLTPARLSVTDVDNEYDVYDARVNGVAATLPPNNECLGETCQPAVIAPEDPTPSSAGFRGQGDPQPQSRKRRCAKGKRLVRRKGKARCLTGKQARKGKARHSKGRRASR
jgi:hypothetical protein